MQRVSDRRRSRHSPSDSLSAHLKEGPVWSPCYSNTIRPLPPTLLRPTLSISVLLSTAFTSGTPSWTRAQKQPKCLEACHKICVTAHTQFNMQNWIILSNVRLKRLWIQFGCVLGVGCVYVCICCVSKLEGFLFYESCLPHSENIAGILSRIQSETYTDCSSLANEKAN